MQKSDLDCGIIMSFTFCHRNALLETDLFAQNTSFLSASASTPQFKIGQINEVIEDSSLRRLGNILNLTS